MAMMFKEMNLYIRFFSEAIGIFALCSSIALSSDPFVPGLVIFAMMGLTGFISGGQFNPAITLGAIVKSYILKPKDINKLIEYSIYIAIQIIVAIFTWLILLAILGESKKIETNDDYENNELFFLEFVFTTLLVGVALTIGETQDSKLVSGTTVAAILIVAGYCLQNINSGPVLNPAAYLSTNIANYANTEESFSEFWLYLIPELLGGILGGLISCLIVIGLKEEKGLKEKEEEGLLNEEEAEDLVESNGEVI